MLPGAELSSSAEIVLATLATEIGEHVDHVLLGEEWIGRREEHIIDCCFLLGLMNGLSFFQSLELDVDSFSIMLS